jgi:hypothetical protein
MSATSKMNQAGQILTSGITVQFYAPTNQLTWFTYLSAGVAGTVPDPPAVTEIIKVEVGDTTLAITNPNLAAVVAVFFQPLIVRSLKSTEVIAGGKYWKNVEKKTATLTAWIFSFTPGNYILMFAPGQGYTAGNSLSITGPSGGSATIVVDSIGIGGSVLAYHVTSNSITYSSYPPASFAFGGSGSGAAFYNINIP